MKRNLFAMCLLGTAMIFSCQKNQNIFPAGEEISADVLSTEEVVDLGLSVKWLNGNLDAEALLDAGAGYAWGSLISHPVDGSFTDSQYMSELMDLFEPEGKDFTVYGAEGDTLRFYVKGGELAGENLPSQYDVATVIDAAWAIPSQAEFEELLQNTSHKYGHIGNTRGWLLTSLVKGYESACIFLPIHGVWSQKKDSDLSRASYWTSTGVSPEGCKTKLGSEPVFAVSLSLSESGLTLQEYRRSRPMMIRPVVR